MSHFTTLKRNRWAASRESFVSASTVFRCEQSRDRLRRGLVCKLKTDSAHAHHGPFIRLRRESGKTAEIRFEKSHMEPQRQEVLNDKGKYCIQDLLKPRNVK